MFTADIVVSFWTSVFWLSTAGVLFVYVGYPVLIWTAARLFGRTPTPFDESRDSLPVVSIIIAAHNEETVIRERIQNLLALDYPSDRLEILIASDGSTDRTCELVREFSAPHLRLLDFAANRGKAAVLNDAFAIARGDIAVLSDANTMMDAQAVRRLVQWFADERVGVVCGRLVLIDPQTGSNADGLYWKYETFLKNCEARLGALLGANGALYAIRRSLYPTLSQRIAVDDFVVPLLARINSGCRIEYRHPRGCFRRDTAGSPLRVRAPLTHWRRWVPKPRPAVAAAESVARVGRRFVPLAQAAALDMPVLPRRRARRERRAQRCRAVSARSSDAGIPLPGRGTWLPLATARLDPQGRAPSDDVYGDEPGAAGGILHLGRAAAGRHVGTHRSDECWRRRLNRASSVASVRAPQPTRRRSSLDTTTQRRVASSLSVALSVGNRPSSRPSSAFPHRSPSVEQIVLESSYGQLSSPPHA